MLLDTELVLDEITSGSSSYATALLTRQVRANGDRIAVHAVAYVLSSGASPELNIQLDHSADGRTWTTVNASPEVNRQALATTGATSAYFAQDLASCGPKLRLSVWQQTSTDVFQVRVWLVTRAHGSRVAPIAAGLRAKPATSDAKSAGCGCSARSLVEAPAPTTRTAHGAALPGAIARGMSRVSSPTSTAGLSLDPGLVLSALGGLHVLGDQPSPDFTDVLDKITKDWEPPLDKVLGGGGGGGDYFYGAFHDECMLVFWNYWLSSQNPWVAWAAYAICMAKHCRDEHKQTMDDSIKASCNLAWDQWGCGEIPVPPENVELCKAQKPSHDLCVATKYFGFLYDCQACAKEHWVIPDSLCPELNTLLAYFP